jgi:hypothetical protein
VSGVTATTSVSTILPSATGAPSSATASPVTTGNASTGLSAGAKAGIAIASIFGALAIVGAVAFVLLRKRKATATDSEFAAAKTLGKPHMAETASLASAETAVPK